MSGQSAQSRRFAGGGRFLMLVLASALFALLVIGLPATLAAAAQMASTNLTLHVPEQVEMATQPPLLVVRIRLSAGVTAQVWAADACGATPEHAFTLPRSGTYQVLQARLGQGTNACLRSSDGNLQASVALDQR